jgi:predicted MFS family arabinose efflux permease
MATSVVFAINGLAFGSWAPHVPLVKERLGLSNDVLGLALLAIAAGALVAMPLAGMLIPRYGSAAVTRVSAAILCACLPPVVAAPNFGLLVAALAAFGAAGAAMDVAMNAQAVAVERTVGRPVMSSFHGAWSVGGMAGAALGGFVIAALSPTGHALAVALLLAVASALALPGLLAGGIDKAAGPVLVRPSRATVGLGALCFLALMGEGAMLDWSAVYLRNDLGAGTTFAAFGYAAFSAAMAAGRFCGDVLRARYGAVGLTAVSAGLAAAGLGLGLISGHKELALLGFACAGLGVSNLVPILFGAAGRTPGQQPGVAIAAVATMGYLGFMVGPPLIGFVADASRLGIALGLIAAGWAVVAMSASALRGADSRGHGEVGSSGPP